MVNKNNRIGITENCDPAFHLEIFGNLYKGNIIVTKRLTDKLIDKLVENKDKVILHLTCTGMGGTKIEPLVPDVETTYRKACTLIEKGFPVEHIVLRIDPIIPTEKGIATAENVVDKFKATGIKRVRISFLDMYKHVEERFKAQGIRLPDNYHGFHADDRARLEAWKHMVDCCAPYGMEIEMCGEPPIEGTDFKSTPCLSQKDIDILGLTDEIVLEGKKEQRGTCDCPANKYQLWRGKPERCEHKCLYCYWKEESQPSE